VKAAESTLKSCLAAYMRQINIQKVRKHSEVGSPSWGAIWRSARVSINIRSLDARRCCPAALDYSGLELDVYRAGIGRASDGLPARASVYSWFVVSYY